MIDPSRLRQPQRTRPLALALGGKATYAVRGDTEKEDVMILSCFRFGHIIELHWNVQQYVQVCDHKGQDAGCGQRESCILTEIQNEHHTQGPLVSDKVPPSTFNFRSDNNDVSKNDLTRKCANNTEVECPYVLVYSCVAGCSTTGDFSHCCLCPLHICHPGLCLVPRHASEMDQ